MRTERAAAPAVSNSLASSMGLKSSRITPLEGDAFFNSAMILILSFLKTCEKLGGATT